MKTTVASFVIGLLSTILLAGLASAHVTVLPKATTQDTYEVITVRVPSEKDAATIKVEVKIPENVNVTRLEPKSGWQYELTKDEDGKIVDIVWIADAGGLSDTEFGDFKIQGKVGGESGELVWKAYQFYDDGSEVEWIGAADSDKPAPVMQVNPKSENTQEIADQNATDTGDKIVTLPMCLSIAALVAALSALVISVRNRRNRRVEPNGDPQ